MGATNASVLAGFLVAAGVGLAACGGSDSPSTPSSQSARPPSSVGTTSQPGEGGAGTTSATPTTGTGSVSRQRAGEIATDKYGGQVISIESDHQKGRATWEVEIKNSHQGRIEVDVAKDTGEILEMEHD